MLLGHKPCFPENLWRVLVTDSNQLVKGRAFKEFKVALTFWALRFVNAIDRYTKLHNIGLHRLQQQYELFPTRPCELTALTTKIDKPGEKGQ